MALKPKKQAVTLTRGKKGRKEGKKKQLKKPSSF